MSEVRREFSLKNLRKALLAAARDTARNLALHGQPVFILREGEVVAMEPAAQVRQRRKTARS